MKKLIYFAAMALTVNMFITSCEKEVENNQASEKEKEDLATNKAIPSENAKGFFELDLPNEIRNLEFGKYEDLEGFDLYFNEDHIDETDFIHETGITVQDRKGNEVSGKLRIHHNPMNGRLVRFEVSDNLRKEAGLNRGHLTALFNNPNSNLDNDDIKELAAGGADCHMTCQNSYRDNLSDCDYDGCANKEWRMYKRCSRGCTWESIKGWFNRIAL